MQFLIIGDVHGCFSKFKRLLATARNKGEEVRPVFVGDMLDRGPECLKMIEYLVDEHPLAVMGNHDWKLARWLWGRSVEIEDYPGIEKTLEALEGRPDLKARLGSYYTTLPFRRMFEMEGKKLHIVHAAAYPKDVEHPLNKNSKARHLYGITTGATDPVTGYPERKEFADAWKDSPDYVAHGHVIVEDLAWRGAGNNVIDLDTGAWQGGPLSGLLFPSMELVQSN